MAEIRSRVNPLHQLEILPSKSWSLVIHRSKDLSIIDFMGLSFDKINCTLFAQILIAQIFAKLKNNKKIFKNRILFHSLICNYIF